MDIAPFELERWFAEYEHEADLMLAESGIRSLDADRFDLDPGTLGYVIPTNGDPDFRAAVGDRYDRGPDEVLFTVGTQEANFLAFQALMDEDDHAVVVTPTYQALHAVPESIGSVTRVGLESPEWTLDVDAVADAIRPETQVIVLNNPNNPTGRYHSQATVEALYDLAAANESYLLVDEVTDSSNRAFAQGYHDAVDDLLSEYGYDGPGLTTESIEDLPQTYDAPVAAGGN